MSKTGSNSIQSAMDWILANPDWQKELSEETDQSESTSEDQSANQESIPVEPKKPLTDEEKQERRRFFLGGSISAQNFISYIKFSNDELHIILKRRNLEICKHSIFFNY